MKGRTPTKDEARHLFLVREMGCIVCRKFGKSTPGVPHHIDGKTKPGAHFTTINLCQNHHQTSDSVNKPPLWISRHGDGRRAFENRYGTEAELLRETNNITNKTPF